MKIVYGLKNGAVLQRDENNQCVCRFCAEVVGKLCTDLGKIIWLKDNMYELVGIPTGGPYEIRLRDNDSEVCVKDVYVGDVWMLAGQSNMEGVGKMRKSQYELESNPTQSVRAYYMNEMWSVAKPQLHQLWESVDSCISERYKRNRLNSPWKSEFPETQVDGVGPGTYYALEMQKKNHGIPQGVIPCGIGGSCLEEWKPDTPDNFYAAMLRRFHACGGNIKGVFWYQGESQTNEKDCKTFVSDMKELVGAMRRDFKNKSLPFVQVQINYFRRVEKEADIWWTKMRELQRTLDQYIDKLATVYSADCSTDDTIHLSSESQQVIGRRAAEAMHYLITGEGCASPQFEKFSIQKDHYENFRINIVIKYKNIVGDLHSLGIPFGFSILKEEDGEPIRTIARTELEGDCVRLKVWIEPEKIEDYYVCYGYGNTYYCNITDGAGRSIPAMGPLKIKDFLK